jgi:hypothetical protein
MNDSTYRTELRRELQNRRIWKRSKSLSDLIHLKNATANKSSLLTDEEYHH